MPDARRFVTGVDGVTMVVEISADLQEAMGILVADGYLDEVAALTVVAAQKDGHDPVGLARHLVHLRRTFREATATIRERTPPCDSSGA